MGSTIKTGEISEQISVAGNVHDVYEIFTDAEKQSEALRTIIDISTLTGERFSGFGGTVIGEVGVLTPETSIEWLWRFYDWPEYHFAHIEIKLESNDLETTIKFKAYDVPYSEVETTKKWWREHYWLPIQNYFGNR